MGGSMIDPLKEAPFVGHMGAAVLHCWTTDIYKQEAPFVCLSHIYIHKYIHTYIHIHTYIYIYVHIVYYICVSQQQYTALKLQLGFNVRSFVLVLKSPVKRSVFGATPSSVMAFSWTLLGTRSAMCIPNADKASTYFTSPCCGTVSHHSSCENGGSGSNEGDEQALDMSDMPLELELSLNLRGPAVGTLT